MHPRVNEDKTENNRSYHVQAFPAIKRIKKHMFWGKTGVMLECCEEKLACKCFYGSYCK